MKISLVRSFLRNQRCNVAVPVGWLMNNTGGPGRRPVAPNKSYVHKTSSQPIVALSRKWSKTSSLLLPQVPLYSEGVKGYSRRSRPQNFVRSTDGQDLDRGRSCEYRAYGSDPSLIVCCQHKIYIVQYVPSVTFPLPSKRNLITLQHPPSLT